MKRASLSGYTLIELLVVMGIVAVMWCTVLPFAITGYKNMQVQVMLDDLKQAVLFSRMHALFQGKALVLRPHSTAGDWAQGMQLWVAHERGRPEGKPLHEWHWKSSGITLTWKGFQSDSELIFQPDLRQSAVNGVFFIQGAGIMRQVVVNRLGRVRVV